MASIRSLSRHLMPQPPATFTLRELLDRRKGGFTLNLKRLPFSMITQNMALMVAPGSYKGTSRSGAVKEIIARIKALSPDVVGLCEVYAEDEKAQIVAGTGMFPSVIKGPYGPIPRSDGGCLLLSKHKMLSKHTLVYFNNILDKNGMLQIVDDIGADKGILHMRIQVPNAPRPYEIFYSHTQNIEEFNGADILYQQLSQMGAFIKSVADPNNPLFIMGDLNIPGEVAKHHKEMITRLLGPVDLWLASGEFPTTGLTFVSNNNFYADASDNPKLNRRLDYILMRAPKNFVPIVNDIAVLKFKVNNRDLSDHFGLRASFNQAVEVLV